MNSFLQLCWERFKSSHSEIEKAVSSTETSYQGLSSEALYTPPEDLLRIFSHPLINGTLVDLGCGHGLSLISYCTLYPDRMGIGIELEESRVRAGSQVVREYNLKNIQFIKDDLLKGKVPKGETYFLYFPTGPVLDRILYELYKSERCFTLVAVESHGDLLRRLALENWLELKDEIPLSSVRHYPFARIYQRKDIKRSEDLLPFSLTFEDLHLVFGQMNQWIGDSFGMEWTGADRFELKTPPRTIFWKDLQSVRTLSSFDERIQLAIRMRQGGEVKILTEHTTCMGYIRKIFISPAFVLELSTGEKVEWIKILKIFQGSALCYDSSSLPF